MEHEHCTDEHISEVRIRLEDALFHWIITFLQENPGGSGQEEKMTA